MSDDDEILQQAASWRDAGQGRGAGHRGHHLGLLAPAGRRQLAVDARRQFVGSVSGGCIEGAVVERGLEVDRRRQAAAARFRRHQRAGLGSRPRLRRQDPGLRRARWNEARASRPRCSRRAAPATRRGAGHRPQDAASRRFIEGDGAEGELALDAAALAAVRMARRRRPQHHDRHGRRRRSSSRCSTRRCACIVVGAVHIAQALAPMAALAGYGVTVIDPAQRLRHRRALSRRRRCSTDWPDEAMAAPQARPAHRRRDPDPRSQARRSRAQRGAASRTPSISARSAAGRPMRRAASACTKPASPRPRSRASTGRSAWTSAPCRRRRSRSPILAQIIAGPARRAPEGPRRRMKFGEIPVADGAGAILAHSLKLPRAHLARRAAC